MTHAALRPRFRNLGLLLAGLVLGVACGTGSGADGVADPRPAAGTVDDGGADAALERDDAATRREGGAGTPGAGNTDAAGSEGGATDAAGPGDGASAGADSGDAGPGDAGPGDAGPGDAAGDAGADASDAAPACGPCTRPPTACHAPVGRCVAGACAYTFVDGATCDDGDACTVADTCAQGACRGVPRVCNAPPSPVCTGARELRTYSSAGSCSAGLCIYAPATSTCATACVAGACVADPCANVTCNAPPAPTCRDASTQVVYGAGTCAQGACAYAPQAVSCSAGCAGGRCNPSGWTRMTSPTNLPLKAVWGSSASAVWAGGTNGTMLFFNGAAWQVRAFPLVGTIYALSGTGPNDVYAATSGGVYHWAGTSWTATSTVGTFDGAGLGSFAPGPAGTLACTTQFAAGHVVSTVTGLSVFTSLAGNLGLEECQLAAFGASDVFVTGDQVMHWDGAQLTVVGNAPRPSGASALWGLSPSFVVAGRYGGIHVWNGATWTTYSAGLAGTVMGFHGTSTTRVFAAVDNGTRGGGVVSFDGLGWTTEPLPTPVPALDAVYAAPTGEVFAVGAGGAIFRGP